MKIVIVGVGALGSHLLQALRNLDATIVVIDDDHVEAKNVLAQFHAKQSVRKNKTKALAALVKLLWGTKIESVPNRLTVDNVDVLLGGAGLIIDCLDNTASRRVIRDYARAHAIPCLHGALAAAEHAAGIVAWDEVFPIDDDQGAGAPTCEDGTNLPFILLTASVMACAVQQWIEKGIRRSSMVTLTGVSRFG